MGDHAGSIPAERTKNKLPHEVPLFPALTELLASIPIIGDNLFKTGRTGDKPLNSFTVAKERLDAAILDGRRRDAEAQGGRVRKVEAMPHWTLHDLRRTMRTRLSKLGVVPEITERVIGHVPSGVRAVYDRHQFREEKRVALARWAQSLANIVDPSDKVVVLSPGGPRPGLTSQNEAPPGIR